MKQSKIEQETIILFNEGEAGAEVYTHNVKLKNKLVKMAKKSPGLYRLKDKNAYGGVMYIFPKKYLTIMFREEISDELKASRRLGYENAQLEKTARKTAGKTPDTDEVRQTPDQAENGAKSPQHSEGFQPQNGTKPPWAE